MSAGAIAVVVAVSVTACFSDDAASQCRELVRDHYGGDTRFVETTFTDGDFFKGIVGQYSGGDSSVVGHWECTVESGDPEITFYSPAG